MRRLPILLTAAAALALPAIGAGGIEGGQVGGPYGTGMQMTTIGTGSRTCVLKPRADCRGVVQRWTAEHHGNLRNARFRRADLRGADFRGADLRGADFRGANLRHADLRGANLRRARFDAPPAPGKQANQTTSCAPNCEGADLAGANLSFTNLSYANLSYANLFGALLQNTTLSFANMIYAQMRTATLSSANLFQANASYANMSQAHVNGAIFSLTNLTGADLAGAMGMNLAVWSNTTCPNGVVTATSPC